MSLNNNKIKYLVADTTAFINAVQLQEYAENVLTVSDVLNEIRNKRQLRRLCVLPYELQVREPRNDSVKHCVEFSKKTGDYASLSGIDIKVIALTYELEVETLGTKHLRDEPVPSTLVASREMPPEFQENINLPGWYKNGCNKSGKDEQAEETDSDQDSEDETDSNNGVDQVKQSIEEQLASEEFDSQIPYNAEKDLETLLENLQVEDDEICNILVAESRNNNDGILDNLSLGKQAGDAEPANEDEISNHSESYDDDGDDSEWITPSNVQKAKQIMKGKIENNKPVQVACMTTDFAIQNTLKQMNLNIAALNGCVITNLRTYILRCYACFKTTSIITKLFCPNCGNKTLKRVAVSLDENGKQVIHINTRRPLTKKYKNQSLPRFRGGKHSHNPILFEDQPMPKQMPSRVAKTKTNALDEDYIAGFSPFAPRDVDSKSAMLRSKGHLKEWARNNSYEEERRKKFYNRVCK